jgi:hypothetical protein
MLEDDKTHLAFSQTSIKTRNEAAVDQPGVGQGSNWGD